MGKMVCTFFLAVLLSSCSNGTIPTNSYFFGPGLGSGLGSAPPRYDLEHDMYLPHESQMAIPYWFNNGGGLSGYSFFWHSNFNWVSKINLKAFQAFDRIAAWGNVMASKERPTPNIDPETKGARVHIKDFRLYILRENNEWHEVLTSERQQNGIGGFMGFYPSSSRKGSYEGVKVVEHIDNNGKAVEVSVQAGAGQDPTDPVAYNQPGFHYHFWWDNPWCKIDPRDNTPAKDNTDPAKNVKGIYVVCKARLIGNYTADPKYLIELGWDYRIAPELDNPTDWAQYDRNGDNGIDDGSGSRMKYVTPEWQYFFFHTFSPEEVKSIKFPGEE